MSQQSYCKRMYLISEGQYKEYYDLKNKFNDQNVANQTTNNDQNDASQITNQSSAEINPDKIEESASNVETGTGYPSNDIKLKKRYSDFIRSTNLQKHIEDKNWKYLYDKILPLLKLNTDLQKNVKITQNSNQSTNTPGRRHQTTQNTEQSSNTDPGPGPDSSNRFDETHFNFDDSYFNDNTYDWDDNANNYYPDTPEVSSFHLPSSFLDKSQREYIPSPTLLDSLKKHPRWIESKNQASPSLRTPEHKTKNSETSKNTPDAPSLSLKSMPLTPESVVSPEFKKKKENPEKVKKKKKKKNEPKDYSSPPKTRAKSGIGKWTKF